jgi:hypothetical protein
MEKSAIDQTHADDLAGVVGIDERVLKASLPENDIPLSD